MIEGLCMDHLCKFYEVCRQELRLQCDWCIFAQPTDNLQLPSRLRSDRLSNCCLLLTDTVIYPCCCKMCYFCCMLILRFWKVELLLQFNFLSFPSVYWHLAGLWLANWIFSGYLILWFHPTLKNFTHAKITWFTEFVLGVWPPAQSPKTVGDVELICRGFP